MKTFIALVAVALMLGGCATTSTPQDRADAVQLAYTPVKTLAKLCAAGISAPCKDLAVRAAVAKAIPIADTAVAETVKQILANPDRTNVAKWTAYAMAAINVLVEALAAYDVKSG